MEKNNGRNLKHKPKLTTKYIIRANINIHFNFRLTVVRWIVEAGSGTQHIYYTRFLFFLWRRHVPLDKSESRGGKNEASIYLLYSVIRSVRITMLHMHVRKKQKEERSASTLSLIKSNQFQK